eukprot:1729909-Heterocapsa_arctica.AAC.1
MPQHHENTRKVWVYCNKNDVSKFWAAPSVGIFWCDQTSVDVDPGPTDTLQSNNYHHSSCQGAIPAGGHVNIGIMGNQ